MVWFIHRARPVILIASCILFLLGIVLTCVENVHGQDFSAEKMGIIEGEVRGLEKSVDTMPAQMDSFRERLVKVESAVDGIGHKMDWILGLMASSVVGVAGLFGSELLKWARTRAGIIEGGSR